MRKTDWNVEIYGPASNATHGGQLQHDYAVLFIYFSPLGMLGNAPTKNPTGGLVRFPCERI